MPMTRSCLARHRTVTIHNREAPVSNLPMELISEIFCIGLHEYDLDDHRVIKYLGAISSTYSAWRDAALGTPSLWRRIVYEDRSDNLLLKTEDPTMFRHTKDRLLAYLSRSKSCSLLLHLNFGTNSLRTQDIKRIVCSHLPRCLSISLGFKSTHSISDFLPLPGNLCRLTEFTCVTYTTNLRSDAPFPIFAEPERVSLRKLTLHHARASLEGIGVQDLEYVRLTQQYDIWPGGATFVSRCHSLTTLIITDRIPFGTHQPFTPFTLPNLIYLDTFGLTMLKAARTPNLQTLILSFVYDSELGGTVIQPHSWPALTTLCVINADANSAEIISLLVSNPGIKRLILSECDGDHDVVQLLKGDDTGGIANADGTAFLPSLSLLQVCESSIPGIGEFRPLCTHRPTLRIEYGPTCGTGSMDADTLKATIEEPFQSDEPGVFRLLNFERRIAVKEDAEPRATSVDA